MNLEELVEAVASLGPKELIVLQEAIDLRYSILADPHVTGYIYDTIRHGLSPRFTPEQIASLAPWKALSDKRRKEFTKAWTNALARLEKRGIIGNVQKLNTALILKSERLNEYALKFTDILSALDNIEESLEKSFPGYGEAGLELLNSRLQK